MQKTGEVHFGISSIWKPEVEGSQDLGPEHLALNPVCIAREIWFEEEEPEEMHHVGSSQKSCENRDLSGIEQSSKMPQP